MEVYDLHDVVIYDIYDMTIGNRDEAIWYDMTYMQVYDVYDLMISNSWRPFLCCLSSNHIHRVQQTPQIPNPTFKTLNPHP